MSYQVLARKWRPRSFETLVGQEHIVKALTHGLNNQRLHHAYLFTGTRGVGKTTIARILAKSLNCELGVTASPCGVCDACQAIDSGRFVDLLEVDAATNTRVDEMRQLLENAVYAPTRGRYKVYVIDEVHMLSNAAFNAMLKTLEEPPEHVKFILATTDPQKIPVTVLSRCLQFNLKQMSQGAILGHLKFVLEQENVPAEEPALRLIAHAASGSMRDALSLLDQAIGYGSGTIVEKSVAAMLGALDSDYLNQIVEALITSEPGCFSAILAEMAARSLSYEAALTGLAELWVDIQTAQVCGHEAIATKPNSGDLASFAAKLDHEYVQLAYTITTHGRAELSLAPCPEAGFLMTLLRLYAFRPADSAEEKKKRPITEICSVQRPGSLPSSEQVGQVSDSFRVTRPPPADPAARSDAFTLESGERIPCWESLIPELGLAGLARELASHCEIVDQSPSRLALRLSHAQSHLLSKANQDKLLAALREKRKIKELSFSLGDPLNETPAQRVDRAKKDAGTRAVEAIDRDPLVRELIEQLEATLLATSVQPVNA
jgi:DNA polymerase III subunit gamma/tau